MNSMKCSVIYASILSLSFTMMIPIAGAEPKYQVALKQLSDAKSIYDDPRPLFKELPRKSVIPPDIYAKLTYNADAMKTAWADAVGFKAPDTVGKIAPEVKPGKYSWQDKEKYPGFRELMITNHYERFKLA